MRLTALALAVAVVLCAGARTEAASATSRQDTQAATDVAQHTDMSAHKKAKRHPQHVHRKHYRQSYGHYNSYAPPPYRYGSHYGPRYGWGPDPGDNAWPPFHFRPYW